MRKHSVEDMEPLFDVGNLIRSSSSGKGDPSSTIQMNVLLFRTLTSAQITFA